MAGHRGFVQAQGSAWGGRRIAAALVAVLALLGSLVTAPAALADPPAAPGAPRTVTAAASIVGDDGRIRVSWSAPTSDGGSPLTGYLVTPTGTPALDPVSVVPGTTSQQFDGLDAGDTYTFTVAAINAIGATTSAATTAATVPQALPAPTGLVAYAGDGKAVLRFSPNIDSSVWLSRFTTLVDGVAVASTQYYAGANHVEIQGLTNGTTYTFTAENAGGPWAGPYSYSAPSNASNAVTPRAVAADTVPRNVVASTPAANQISVSWTVPLSDGGSPITGYLVQRGGGLSHVVAASATSYTFTSVPAGGSFTASVQAITANGLGAMATSNAVNVYDASVPNPPTMVNGWGYAYDDVGEVHLTWTAPTTNGGSSITGYQITSSAGGTPIIAPGTATTYVVSNLTKGATYTFTVKAINAAGMSTGTVAGAVTVPLGAPAPTNVVAIAGDGKATVSWSSASTGPWGFHVAAYGPGGVLAGEAWVDGTERSALVPGLTNGTPYTFTVREYPGWYSSSKESAPSAPVTPQSTPVTVPGAPTGVSAQARVGGALVSWTAPTANGGASITGYRVTAAPGNQTMLVSGASTTSATFNGLTAGTPATFTVQALNSAGSSAASAASNAVTVAANPASPTNVTATAVHVVGASGRVTVNWTAPTNTGHSSITGYRVTPSSGSFATTTGTATSYTMSGLTPGAAYTFNVRTLNAAGGISAQSGQSASVTIPQAPPAPTLVSAISGNGKAFVTFTPPVLPDLITYRATAYQNGVAVATSTIYANEPAVEVTGLTNGVAYTVKVEAGAGPYNGPINYSLPSAASNVVTPAAPTALPGALQNVSANPNGPGGISLYWSPPANASTSAINRYRLNIDGWVYDVLPTRNSVHFESMEPGHTYTFSVTALNSLGSGPTSTVTAKAATTPAAVTSVTAVPTTVGSTASAVVSWTPATELGHSTLCCYRIDAYAGSATTPVSKYTINGGPMTFTNLTPGTSYRFDVSFYTLAQIWSPVTSTTVTMPTAPGAPTGVTAGSIGDHTARVNWTAPTSTGSAPLRDYTVTPYVDGVAQTGLAKTVVAPATTTDITGLTTETLYTFKVVATNGEAGGPSGTSVDSAASNPVEATSASKPGAPTGVTAEPGVRSATVSWTAPADDGGAAIEAYSITMTPGGTAHLAGPEDDSFGFEDLTPGTEYTFTVKALNAAGAGPASAAAVATAATEPAAPTGLNVTDMRVDATAGDAQVSWDAVTDAGYSTLTGYEISALKHADNSIVVRQVGAATTSLHFTGLEEAYEYTFTVRARNAAGGLSVGSAPFGPIQVPVSTHGPNPPAVYAGDGLIRVRSYEDAPSGVWGYRYTLYADESAVATELAAAGHQRVVFDDVVNGTEYVVRMQALAGAEGGPFNASYYSDPSDVVVPVSATAVPGAPTDVFAYPLGDGAVSVYWWYPEDVATSAIDHYVVEPSSGGSYTIDADLVGDSYVVDGLTPGTDVTFSVRAVNAIGSSAASASESVTVATVPDQAIDTRVEWTTTGTSATARVYYAYPEFTGYSPPLVGRVRAYIGEETTPFYDQINGPSTYREITGLQVGQEYRFEVTYMTHAEIEPPPVVHVSTPPVAPGTPTNVTATAGPHSAHVTFDAPVEEGTYPVSRYLVTPYVNGVATTSFPREFTGTSGVVAGLTAGVEYTFRVSAVGDEPDGPSRAFSERSAPSGAVTALDATVPDAPTGVSAVLGPYGVVTLTWDPATNAATMPISQYRVTMLPDQQEFAPVPGSQTSVQISGVPSGQPRTFTVRAVNAQGTGAASAPSNAITMPAYTGQAPTVAPGDGEVEVQWHTNAGGGVGNIRHYRIEASPGGATMVVPSGQLSAMFGGLTNGTAYTFTVTALGEFVEGDPTPPSATVVPGAGPNAPVDVTAQARVERGDGIVTVSWEPPVLSGAGTIGRFKVTSANGESQDVAFGVRTAEFSGMQAEDVASFAVRAHSEFGWSLPATVSVTLPTVSGVVPSVTAVAGPGSATVSWAPPEIGALIVDHYRVVPFFEHEMHEDLAVDTNGPELTAVVTGLPAGVGVVFVVYPVTASGDCPSYSVTSNDVWPEAGGDEPPGPPTDVVATAGDASATVTWTAPGGAVTGYTVIASPGGASVSVDGESTSAEVTGLTNGTSYTFTVTAENAAGVGEPSAASSAVFPAGSPSEPVEVSAQARTVRGDGRVTITWEAPADSGGATLTGYDLTPAGGSAIQLPSTAGSHVITGLEPGAVVAYELTARNAVGASDPVEVSATVPDVPSAPEGVVASAGDAEALVEWAPPQIGGAVVHSYLVTPYAGGVPDEDLAVTVVGTETSVTVPDLVNGTEYRFTVVAHASEEDSGPESEPSEPVTPFGEGFPPEPPSDVLAVAGNGKATVRWSPVPWSDATSWIVTSEPGGVTATVDASQRTAVVNGLTNGVSYSFTVHGVNGAGAGDPSEPSNAVTPDENVSLPPAPSDAGVYGYAWDGVGYAEAYVDDLTLVRPDVTGLHATLEPGGHVVTGENLVTFEGLEPGAYTMTLRSISADGVGTESVTFEITVPVAPSAPTDVVVNPGVGNAEVTWQPPAEGAEDVHRYMILPVLVGQEPDYSMAEYVYAPATSVTIEGLDEGASYVFHVMALTVDYDGSLTALSEETRIFAASEAPGQPLEVAAEPQGAGQAIVSWLPPLDAGSSGESISAYTVILRCAQIASLNRSDHRTLAPRTGGASLDDPNCDLRATAQVSSANQPNSFLTLDTEGRFSFRVIGLTPGVAYEAIVVARVGSVVGVPSDPSMPFITGEVGPPRNLVVVPGLNSITLSWDPPEDPGTGVTGYRITPSTSVLPVVTVDGETTTYTYENVPNHHFLFEVQAVTDIGVSAAVTHDYYVEAKRAPVPPNVFTAAPRDGGAYLYWYDNWNGSVEDPITSATIHYAPVTDGTLGEAEVVEVPIAGANVGRTRLIEGLENGQEYAFWMTLTNAVTTSIPSVERRVIPGTPSVAPADHDVYPRDSGLYVTWLGVSDTSGAGPVTGYVINYEGADGHTGSVITAAPDRAADLTGLTNGVGYRVTVAAINQHGAGVQTPSSPVVTPRTLPDAPTGVVARPGAGSAAVAWTAPAWNGGSAVTNYRVVANPGGATALATTTGRATEAIVRGLDDGTEYTFTVHATNAAGEGPASDPSAGLIPVGTVPDAPSNVRTTSYHKSVDVRWDRSWFDGGSAVTGYTVTASPGGSTVQVSGSSSQTMVTGLSNRVSYTFTVMATNGIGDSPASAPSSPVRPAGVPTVPVTDVTVTPLAADSARTSVGSVLVRWKAPSDADEAALTGYRVFVTTPDNPNGYSLARTVAPSPTSARFHDIPMGEGPYFVRVAPINVQGAGPSARSAGTFTPAPGTPRPTGGALGQAPRWNMVGVQQPGGAGLARTKDGAKASASTSIRQRTTNGSSAPTASGGTPLKVMDAGTYPGGHSMDWVIEWDGVSRIYASSSPSSTNAPIRTNGLVTVGTFGRSFVPWYGNAAKELQFGEDDHSYFTTTNCAAVGDSGLGGTDISRYAAHQWDLSGLPMFGPGENLLFMGVSDLHGCDDVPVTLAGPIYLHGVTGGYQFPPDRDPADGIPNCKAGDPVDCHTGSLVDEVVDLGIPGRGPDLAVRRAYNSRDVETLGRFGYGWTDNYATTLFQEAKYSQLASSQVTVRTDTGAEMSFQPNGKGGYDNTSPKSKDTLVPDSNGGFVLDRRGHGVYTFDATGLLVKHSDLNDNALELSYDASGHIDTVTDAAGRFLSYVTNTDGTIASIVDSTGRELEYEYDAGTLVQVTDVTGDVVSHDYDEDRRLTVKTDGRGKTTTSEFNQYNQVVEQTDGNGGVSTWEYLFGSTTFTTPEGRKTRYMFTDGQLTALTKGFGTPDAATEHYSYSSTTGEMVRRTDGEGNATRMEYDADGNLTKVTDAHGQVTRWTYDALGNKTSRTEPSPSGSGTVTTTWTYDARGNLLEQSRPALTYHRDDPQHPGDVTGITDALGRTTTFVHDASGLVESVTDPEGRTSEWSRDARGFTSSVKTPKGGVALAQRRADGLATSIEDAEGNVTQFTYNGEGVPATITDAAGQTVTYTYDNVLQPLRQDFPDGTFAAVTYDGDGKQISQRDPSGTVSTYAYDGRGRVVSVTEPASGTTTTAYDDNDNILVQTDAAGETVTSAYDDLNRRVSAEFSGDREDVAFAYNAAGLLMSATTASGAATYSYDAFGRMLSSTDENDDTVGYSYDAVGNVTELTYPDGERVEREFDDSNRMTAVTDWDDRTSTFGYDANGNLSTITYPNGVTEENSYDAENRLVDRVYERGATVLGSFAYGRDDLGRISTTVEAGTALSAVESYTYDENGRIDSMSGSAIEHDADDNVLTLPGGVGLTYATDGSDQVVDRTDAGGTTVFTYDDRGRRAGSSGAVDATYEWDQAGGLTSATVEGASVSFDYSANGTLAATESGGTTVRSTWTKNSAFDLLISHGSTKYVYGPDGRAVSQTTGDVAEYLHQDHQGSTRLITDDAGAVAGSYSYDLAGNVTAHTGAATCALRWSGQLQDTVTGFLYMRARWYDPSTSQFVSVDPLVSFTRTAYGYGPGDQLNFSDLEGLAYCVLGLASSGACRGQYMIDNGLGEFVDVMDEVTFFMILGGGLCSMSVVCAPVGAPIAAIGGAASLGMAPLKIIQFFVTPHDGLGGVFVDASTLVVDIAGGGMIKKGFNRIKKWVPWGKDEETAIDIVSEKAGDINQPAC